MNEIEEAFDKFRRVVAQESTSSEDYVKNLKWIIEDLEVEIDAAESCMDRE